MIVPKMTTETPAKIGFLMLSIFRDFEAGIAMTKLIKRTTAQVNKKVGMSGVGVRIAAAIRLVTMSAG